MCCLLCWKAAARWTETADLRREQFVSVTSCEVIIYWGRGTKTTRLNPFRPHLYAIVTGPGTPELAQHIQSMKPRATTLLHDSPRDGPSNTINTRSGVRDALYQKGGNHSSVSRNLSRKFAHAGGSKPNKTPEHRITAQIQCKQRYNGTGPRDTTSVCTPSGTLTTSHVTKCFHEVPYLRRHLRYYVPAVSSRLAIPKDMSLPLHVKKSIPVIKLDKVKEWLNPAAATRFRKVLNELLWVPTGPYPEPSVRGSLPRGRTYVYLRTPAL